MRFKYSFLDDVRSELRFMPLLPCTLRNGQQETAVIGLVDSGAMVNVLPHHIGLELGGVWNEADADLALGRAYAGVMAMRLPLMVQVAEFPPVRLVFAWAESDDVRVLFGQANFFMEFDVHFYRAQLEFEINPKSDSPRIATDGL